MTPVNLHLTKSHYDGAPCESPFGYDRPERDKREMCVICKNEDTRRLNGLELLAFEEYYGHARFKAFECSACRGLFHYTEDSVSSPCPLSPP